MKTVYLIGVDSTTPTATMAAVLMKLRGPDVSAIQPLLMVTTALKLMTVYLMIVKMETVWMRTVAIDVSAVLDSVEDSVKTTLMTVLESRVVAEESVWMEFTTSPVTVTQAILEPCVNQVEHDIALQRA